MALDYRNTCADVREAQPAIALLPIGATEQQGRHLPVGAATIIADAVAEGVAKALTESVYRLPTIPFGTSISSQGTAGTVSFSWSTLMAVITDLVESLLAAQIRRVVVLDSVGGPCGTMTVPFENEIVKTTIRQLNYDHPELDVLWVQPFTAASAELKRILSAPGDDLHAGELSTSLMLYLAPYLVTPGAVDHVPSLGIEFLDWVPLRALCPDGTWGRPSAGTAEKGRAALDAAVRHTAAYIKETFDYLTKAKRRVRAVPQSCG